MIRQRRDREPHEIHVVDRVRLFGRQVRTVAVRPHQCQDNEVRLQRESVLSLEGSRDAWVDAHGLTTVDPPARSPTPARRTHTRALAAAARRGQTAPTPRYPERTRATQASASPIAPAAAAARGSRAACTPDRK